MKQTEVRNLLCCSPRYILHLTAIKVHCPHKIAAAMFSFINPGLFNSSVGAILPLLSHPYHHVSLVFLAGSVGYVLAAKCSDIIHDHYGQRGIAIIGPIFQFIWTAIAASHPSFGGVLVVFEFQGLGAGLLDGSCCARVGSMSKANAISGLLHESYLLGWATESFLVTIDTTRNKPWYSWHSILVLTFRDTSALRGLLAYKKAGASALSFITLTSAFCHEDVVAYRKSMSKQLKVADANPDARIVHKYSAVWLCAAYFIAYVGTKTAISGWVISLRTPKDLLIILSKLGIMK